MKASTAKKDKCGFSSSHAHARFKRKSKASTSPECTCPESETVYKTNSHKKFWASFLTWAIPSSLATWCLAYVFFADFCTAWTFREDVDVACLFKVASAFCKFLHIAGYNARMAVCNELRVLFGGVLIIRAILFWGL